MNRISIFLHVNHFFGVQVVVEQVSHVFIHFRLNLEADKKVVYITPVRRSTRKSRSYLNTPDSNLYSSIQEARESVGEISFRGNRLLAARFNNE